MIEIGRLMIRKTILFLACLAVASCTGLTKQEVDAYSKLTRNDDLTTVPDVCPVHQVQLEETAVPGAAGFAVLHETYTKARLKHFPYSFFEVVSGYCEGSGGFYIRKFCETCRRKELAWRKRHGWSLPKGALE